MQTGSKKLILNSAKYFWGGGGALINTYKWKENGNRGRIFGSLMGYLMVRASTGVDM
jgi:hypothetical protein